MKKQHSERVTENIVDHFYYDQQKEDTNINIIPQATILGGSKKKGSKKDGKAEFGIENSLHPDILLLVECKAEKVDHEKAKQEAIDYKRKYEISCEELGIKIPFIATLAVSGKPDDYLATMVIPNKYTKETIEIEDMLLLSDVIKRIDFNKDQFKVDEEEALVFAKRLHNFLRDHISASESEKPLIISAVAMALKDPIFTETFKTSEQADCSIENKKERKENQNLVRLLLNSLDKSLKGMVENDASRRSIISSFNFLLHKDSLYNICTDTDFIKHAVGKAGQLEEHTNLFIIIEGLRLRLFQNSFGDSDFDIFGKFYDEFIKYTGGDGSGLGIVTTPRHILDLSCELGGIDVNSIVYDPCTGTGAYLVTALAKMVAMAGDDVEKIDLIKKQQLFGVELKTDMFTLAAANMIFKGDGHPDILNGSCFDFEIETKKRKSNLAPFNPPYGLKTNGLKELDFILHTCNMLTRDGKTVVIIPRSVGNPSKGILKEVKKDLFKNHTLETVIGLPNDLFEKKASVPTMILIFTSYRPHSSNHYTQLINFEDDGFRTILKTGRVDFNYQERKKELLNIINTRKVIPGISSLQQLGYNDEWSIEKHVLNVDYKKLEPSSFLEDDLHQIYKQIDIDPFSPSKAFTKPTTRLKTEEWREFKLKNIFTINNSKGPKISELDEVSEGVPLINASKSNGGVCRLVSIDEETALKNNWSFNSGSCITAPKNGSILDATYRKKDQKFLTSNGDVMTLYFSDTSVEMTKNIGKFLVTIFRLIANEKYKRYGYNFTKDRALDEIIKLPSKKNKATNSWEVDWAFMEKYIDEFDI